MYHSQRWSRWPYKEIYFSFLAGENYQFFSGQISSPHSSITYIDCLLISRVLVIEELDAIPKDLGKSWILPDEHNVASCQDVIKNWGNPSALTNGLFAMSSGVRANDKVKEDLLSAEVIGRGHLNQLICDRITSSKTKFYAPMKNLSLLLSHLCWKRASITWKVLQFL